MAFVHEAIAWLRTLGDVTAIGLAIATALAFIPHTFVNEWIRTRFAKQVEREGREHQAKLQKDLEDYRDRLLQQLDERRLALDLRRSVALQASAAKLEFIRKLSASVTEFSSYAASIAALPVAARAGMQEELNKRRGSLMTLRLEADIYLEQAVSGDILTMMLSGSQLTKNALQNGVVLPPTDPAIVTLHQQAAGITNRLRQSFQALLESGHVIE